MATSSQSTKSQPHSAGFMRRIAALVYDSLVVTALLFLASALVMLLITLTLGEAAITEDEILVENPFYFSFLVLVWYYYYAWCWKTGGQTLGMKAWRLKLVPNNEQIFSHKNAAIRFFSCLLGLANFSILLPGKTAWHDKLSDSTILVIDKND